jgi:GR25 family glycosyltransferase involved in LPS biosynthesis
MDGQIQVYCINLESRKDRWTRFNSQIEINTLKQIYPFERFSAILGSDIDILNDERISMRSKRNIIEGIRRDHEELDTPGGVGCYLSHTTLWKKLVDSDKEYAMIFEDDAVIPLNFVHQFQSAIKDIELLPKKPDVWYFSGPTKWYYESKGKALPHTENRNQNGPWVTSYCSTFTGYLISKNGAKLLLERAFPIDMHVDLYSCLVQDLGTIFSVYHKSIKISQDLFAMTDIQSSSSCKICDIPTKGLSTSTIVVSMPIFIIGLSIIGVLMFVKELNLTK